MKRYRWQMLPLLAAILICFSCCSAGSSDDSGLPLLYYRDAGNEQEEGIGILASENGILGTERWSYSEELPSFDAFLNQYFSGPVSDSLVSPFPSGLQCIGTSLDDGVLTVILSEAFNELAGIDRSVAISCITTTLTQFSNVSGVCLEVENSASNGEDTAVLTAKDFVLEDLGAVNTETAVRLYFSDANGRYLVSTERSSYFSDASQIPGYVVQQLLEGPTEQGQLAVMPEGTTLLGISVNEDGCCTVNLSSGFLYNKPTTGFMERMTILSLVNSLTELKPVKSVRILVDGNAVGQYLNLDLDRDFVRDESAIDVVRTGLRETDATFYVCGSNMQLAPVPVCIRATNQMSLQEALLNELLSFEPINGMESPIPEGTQLLNVQMQNNICHVDLSEQLLECAGDADREQLALRAITMTLTSLDNVAYVKLSVNGSSSGFTHFPLDRIYTPGTVWKP